MSSSKFICASLPSVYRHFSLAVREYPNYIDTASINRFFKSNVDKYLTSIGNCIGNNQKVTEKLFNNYTKSLKKMLDFGFFDNCEINVDSGGFQVQQGYLKNKDDIDKYIELYHSNFLENNSDLFDYAFLLDLVPGVKYTPFDNWKDLIRYNRKSYQRSNDLPEHIRNKMYYIHHFRTPKLNEIYKKFLFEEKLGDGFKNFSTGGLVSYGGLGTPFSMYIVPLVHILYRAIQMGEKSIRFHVLGDSEYKSILFHKLVEVHVKKMFNINLTITYDSSTVFKIFMMSRFLYVLDDDTKKLWKLDVSSNNLNEYWKGRGLVKDIFCKSLNEAVSPFGMKPLDLNEESLYRDCKKFSNLIYAYGMCQMLYVYNKIDNWCQEIAKDLYKLYEQDEHYEFSRQIDNILKNFSDGKYGKSIKQKSNSIRTSLDIIKELDIDFCDYLVQEYLGKDEFSNFEGNSTNLILNSGGY